MSSIPVIEIFGPTIQGEGTLIGQKTMFVRTAGCDYTCAWCDSKFTWDGSMREQIKQMTPDEIWTVLLELGGDNFSHITISGGNPVLLNNMSDFITLLKEKKIRSAIETQGSIWKDWLLEIDEITVSPKPPSSRMETNLDMLDLIISRLSNKNVSLKIVIFDENDFFFATKIHQRYPLIPFILQVGNDDINTTNNDELIKRLLSKYEWLIDKTIQCKEMNNIKVLPQLHTLVWGNKRGV